MYVLDQDGLYICFYPAVLVWMGLAVDCKLVQHILDFPHDKMGSPQDDSLRGTDPCDSRIDHSSD